jgi:hypothetical protein
MYNRRPVVLRILAGGKPVADIELSDVDPRRWAPGKTVELKGTAPPLPPLGKGGMGGVSADSVTIALWMPDQAAALRARPEYSVRFANQEVWDEAAGHNVLAKSVPVR